MVTLGKPHITKPSGLEMPVTNCPRCFHDGSSTLPRRTYAELIGRMLSFSRARMCTGNTRVRLARRGTGIVGTGFKPARRDGQV
jgi:hypothetical protein